MKRRSRDDDYTIRVPYGPQQGETLDVSVLGYVSSASAFIVKHLKTNSLVIIHEDYINPKPPKTLLSVENIAHFEYQIGGKVNFKYDEGIEDTDGKSIAGKISRAQVLHHILDGRKKWYVVHVPKDDIPGDPDNWYCAYDVCTAENGKLTPINRKK